MNSDPLFVGITRPSMLWGASYDAVMAGGLLTAIVFIGTGSLLSIFMYIPIHAIAYLACLHDPKTPRLFLKWVDTKGRSTSRVYWGASSGTPFINTRKRRRL